MINSAECVMHVSTEDSTNIQTKFQDKHHSVHLQKHMKFPFFEDSVSKLP